MSDWKDDEFTELTCPECGAAETKEGKPFTAGGLNQHRTVKHGWRKPDSERPPSPGGRKTSRQESLRASLGIVALGVGMLDPYDGQVLTTYIPAQAAALDAAAKEYKWAEKICEYLTMAGPVTMLSTAFLPPIFMILAHHRILPGPAADGLARAMGGPQQPPPQQAAPMSNGLNPDGSMDFGGIHYSADDLQRFAERFVGTPMTGASEVIIGDNGGL